MRGNYFLFYAGLNTRDGIEQIGLATSSDGRTFARAQHAPVIPLGTSGEADDAQTSNPCVLFDRGTFRMWYQGKSNDGVLSICYAESKDARTWTGFPEHVFSPSRVPVAEYRYGFQHPHVVRESDRYRMWFSTQAEGRATISYAESADGYVWVVTKPDVLVPTEPWEGSFLYYPFVSKCADGSYEMWYTGRPKGLRWQTGRARSKDGRVWERDTATSLVPARTLPSPVRRALELMPFPVSPSLNGSGSPFLFSANGKTQALMHDVGRNGRLSIGLYEVTEGGRFSRVTSDLLGGAPDAWDAYFQADPFLLIHE